MMDRQNLNQMVETIVVRFHPEKIILFGSYARGEQTRDSDVDLMVVLREEGSKRRKAAEIDLALADRAAPLDLVVVTPEEVEKYRGSMGTVIHSALTEGKALYVRVG